MPETSRLFVAAMLALAAGACGPGVGGAFPDLSDVDAMTGEVDLEAPFDLTVVVDAAEPDLSVSTADLAVPDLILLDKSVIADGLVTCKEDAGERVCASGCAPSSAGPAWAPPAAASG